MSDTEFSPGLLEPALEEQVERWIMGLPSVLLDEQKRELVRFLQLARRDGARNPFRDFTRFSIERPFSEQLEEEVRRQYPIRRTVTEPNIQHCAPGGPWVRSDGKGGVNFFLTEQGARDYPRGEYPLDMRNGLHGGWLHTITHVAANPTITQEVEE